MKRVDRNDEAAMDAHNKCEDCCAVIGCDTCGPCPEHDRAATYIEEVESIADSFRYEDCEVCGADLDRYTIAPDPLGHAHLYCMTEPTDELTVGRQDACSRCGHDVEWHGEESGWIDRGSGTECLPYRRRDGELVRPQGQHYVAVYDGGRRNGGLRRRELLRHCPSICHSSSSRGGSKAPSSGVRRLGLCLGWS